MAKLKLILQPLNAGSHAHELRRVLTLPGLTQALISVAYLRESGVEAISTELAAVADRTTAFVGIRNDITSSQGLEALLKLGVKVYTVDTGTRSRIFHPKIYYAESADRARAIVGSSNLTHGGLHNNIEAGVALELDLPEGSDADFATSISDRLKGLRKNHPRNVSRLVNAAAVQRLLDDSRIVDERVANPPRPKSKAGTKVTPSVIVDPIDLPFVGRTFNPTATPPKPAPSPKAPPAAPSSPRAGVTTPATGSWLKVWESNGLTERDLNIPKNDGTHPTGSMTLKKGATEGIDQRHYFRDEVFDHLQWVVTSPSHIERATVDIEIVIAGVSFGTFTLGVTHNTLTNTKTYKQRNAMSSLFWNDAKPVIAQSELLGRTATLYRNLAASPSFILEID